MTKLTNELQIEGYIHCGKCLDELPEDISPEDWARTQAGWTEQGLQIWCNRHNCNVVHIDFEGHQHPANMTSPEEATKEPLLTIVG